MFVVFEGIDGSGKTTVSNRVAKRLRAGGVRVDHVREGGEFASPLVTRLREVGKDPRNLALEPWAELMFYLAREAQILAELTRPALAGDADVVMADRYLHSYEVLSHHARGLDRARVQSALDAVAGGLWPDLVVLLDVDPHVARARRRVSKIQSRAAGAEPGGGSRKGLAGVGAQRRMREGYLELAAAHPDRWLVVDNSALDASLDGIVARVVDAIQRGRGAAPSTSGSGSGSGSDSGSGSGSDSGSGSELEDVPERFYAALEARAAREPAVAAYLLAGLSDPPAHGLRANLADRAPHVAAWGLRGVGGEPAWLLRERLVDTAPKMVAHSLAGLAVEGPRAHDLRARLVDAEPAAVIATLGGNDSPEAWELRRRAGQDVPAQLVISVRQIGSEQAWQVRQDYLERAGGEGALADPAAAGPLASSLRGLGDERAWRLRRLCFEAAPVATLGSLTDVGDDESWAWRERWVERAPKAVLHTLVRQADARGWALRRRVIERVKEALDAMRGDDSEPAWALREEFTPTWPSTAVKSLGPLYAGERGRALADRALACDPDDLSLMKHITALEHDASGSGEEDDA